MRLSEFRRAASLSLFSLETMRKSAHLSVARDLEQVSPEQVFRACYQRHRAEDRVPEDLLGLFHELVDDVGRIERP